MTEEKIIHLVEKKQGAYGSYKNGVELELLCLT